jgi:predicted metal-binding protein
MISRDALLETGIWQYGVVSPAEIVFSDEFQKICRANACRCYGKTWACPPAVGTTEQCRQRCLHYQSAVVFSAKYPLEDSFDYEGMLSGHDEFKKLCDKVYALVKQEDSQFLLLSNEGCKRCNVCTYPASPCRMPELLFPSVEGFGINVKQLADAAGISYCNGANTVTYFGVLLLNCGNIPL